MTKKSKLLKKFLNNPASIPFQKIEKILASFGFERINAKGSHLKFNHTLHKWTIIIPIHNNDCLPYYKQQIKKILLSKLPHEKKKHQ